MQTNEQEYISNPIRRTILVNKEVFALIIGNLCVLAIFVVLVGMIILF